MKKLIVCLGIAGITLSAGAAQAQSAPEQAQFFAQGDDSSISPTERYSYVGVAGNVGLSDLDRSVADDGVAIISKIAILDNVSVRPSVIFGDDTAVTIPVTYDFKTGNRLTPYVGAGIVADGDVDFLATSGVDYRFSRDFVGNVGINVGFADDTDVGLTFGVGYVFSPSR